MSELLLITFRGCPHAGAAREVLRRSGRPFREVLQDDLPAGDALRGYTSPTVLRAGRIVFGAASDAPGCSAARLDAEALLAALDAAAPAPTRGG
jgi:hypothetical protein